MYSFTNTTTQIPRYLDAQQHGKCSLLKIGAGSVFVPLLKPNMLHSGAAAHMRAYMHYKLTSVQWVYIALAAGKENAGPRYVKRGNQSAIYDLLLEHFIQFFALFHCWKNWLSPSLWIESSACAVSQGRKGLVGRIKVSIRNYVKEPACRSNVSIMMVGWGDKSSTLVLFDSTLGWDQAKGEQPPSELVLSHFTLNNRRDWMISKFAFILCGAKFELDVIPKNIKEFNRL